MQNGALFGVPIPEEFEAVGITLQEAVERALLEAERQGINKLGKEATPWLLRRVGELTEGKSLASSTWLLYIHFFPLEQPISVDIALIENTALVGEPDVLHLVHHVSQNFPAQADKLRFNTQS